MRNPAKPSASAARRTGVGMLASAPGGTSTMRAITPPSTAVATARTHTTTGAVSSSPRASTMPSQRQISLGRKPTSSSNR